MANIMIRVHVIPVLVFILAFTSTASAQPQQPGEELYRIRITNSTGGPVELSVDGGQSYGMIGKVTTPAVTAIASFGAAAYVPVGTIAATAIHGLRIKTAQMPGGQTPGAPLTISVVPKEFARTPNGYGGHQAGSSGMLTDIPSGTSIFRDFAPFAGSKVRIQHNSRLDPIGENYRPKSGDVYVIIVERPEKWPDYIEFENRTGGAVNMVFADGTKEQITTVLHPVLGVGRYDGTSYTGVGRINTNHGGVLTISTAPISDSPLLEGDGPERRGGFMIQPSYHTGTVGGRVPQLMVVGPDNPTGRLLEGKPPLFNLYFGLAYDPSDPANSYHVQAQIDDGDWEDLPAMVGKINDAFSPAQLSAAYAKSGKKRTIKTGVTAIRVKFPRLDRQFLVSRAEKARGVYASAVLASGKGTAVSGILTVNAVTKNSAQIGYVAVNIDGHRVAMSNSIPYAFDWDTTTVPDGAHTIEILGMDDTGNIITRKSTQVVVKNQKVIE